MGAVVSQLAHKGQACDQARNVQSSDVLRLHPLLGLSTVSVFLRKYIHIHHQRYADYYLKKKIKTCI